MARAVNHEYAFVARCIINYNTEPNMPRPVLAPIPVLDVDFEVEQLMNTRRYVSIELRVDDSVFGL
jgi:hypothetical protein